ncbi:hypothetical protein H4S08_003289 [Coemansia sp. RSA 1365]|nr:hypothetical protein H4S08_003289 [Coemansia sp. RSA 1365]
MRCFAAFALLLVIPVVVAQSPEKCEGMHVRRSAHDLSSDDWQRIENVISQMRRDGHFDRFARAHQTLFNSVHGSTTFFPFHRRFVQEFEDIGRKIDPAFAIPYWDTTLDYEDPASSPILRDDTLGGNGQGPNHCLSNGIQGGWDIGFPDRHCLRREFNDGDSIEPWVPAEVISSYIQSDDSLSLFREHIEYGIHGAVHLGLGGDDSTRYAPVDLFFFMHHANIDRLWWLWQNNQHDPLDYNGPGTNGEASLEDIIPQNDDVDFGGDQAGAVMVLGYGPVCYTYDSAPDAPSEYPASNSDNSSDPNRLIYNNTISHISAFSGSSNTSSLDLEIARIRAAMNSDFSLKSYFPAIAALDSSRIITPALPTYHQDFKCKGRPAKKLVHPAPMTNMWIKMHGFDPERVGQLYDESCRLIDRLNNSTYVSPY